LNKNISCFEHTNSLNLLQISINNKPFKKLIKDTDLFETIIIHMPYNFAHEALEISIKYLEELHISDTRLSKEISENAKLTQLIFDLSIQSNSAEFNELTKLQMGILRELLVHTEPKFAEKIMKFIKVQCHSILLLSLVTDYYFGKLDNLNEKICANIGYKLLCYLEDFALFNPDLPKNTEFTQILAKLILIFDKLNLLYVSTPIFPIFDKRFLENMISITASKQSIENREGGILRILIKLIFLSIRNEPNETADTCTFVKYLVFREKIDKISIKQLAGISKLPEFEEIKKCKKKKKYSILDIYIKKDPVMLKIHKSRTEFYYKKVISAKGAPLLDVIKMTKLKKDEDLFDTQNPLLVIYILGQLFQNLHFELFKIDSYEKMANIADDLHQFQIDSIVDSKNRSNKYKEIISIITQIIKSVPKAEIQGILTTEFSRIMIETKSKRCAYFTPIPKTMIIPSEAPSPPPETESSLSTTFVVVTNEEIKENPTNLTAEQQKTHFSQIAQFDPESGDIMLSTPDSQFAKFMVLWEMFCETLISNLSDKFSTIDSCNVISTLLVMRYNIRLIQPYLVLCTAEFFNKYDRLIMNRIPTPLIPARPILSEECKTACSELEFRIRDKFCYIGVHKEKIDRDELRNDFESFTGGFVKKLIKKQNLEINPWHNKQDAKMQVRIFEFISRQYEKMMKRCLLYKHLENEGKIKKSTVGGFTSLMKSRDKLGRAMKLKKINILKQNRHAICANFKYLARFTMKKLMILHISDTEQRKAILEDTQKYFKCDFEFKFQKELYIPFSYESTHIKQRTTSISMSSEFSSSEISSEHELDLQSNASSPNNILRFQDHIPKSIFIQI